MPRDNSNEGWPCDDCGRPYVQSGDPCPYCENARLRAVIDKLLKTAEGVPITHLMKLFSTRPMVFPNGARLQGADEQPLAFVVESLPTNGACVDWEHVYATPEAASAAGGKGVES